MFSRLFYSKSVLKKDKHVTQAIHIIGYNIMGGARRLGAAGQSKLAVNL